MKKGLFFFLVLALLTVSLCSCKDGEAVVGGDSSCNHEYGEWSVLKEPTCSEPGIKTRFCKLCSQTELGAIEKTAHVVVTDPAVPPTCTEAGKTEGSHCSLCGEIFTAQTDIPATGHDYGSAITVTKATCKSEGSVIYVCNKCNFSKTETTPVSGHDFGDPVVVKKATCTENGVERITCSVCGYSEDRTLSSSGAHKYDSGKVTKKATCSESGVKTYTCSVCGATKTEKIAATGQHTYDSGKVTKKATCTDSGVKTYTCSVCGTTKTEKIAATGKHTYDSGKITKAATCTSAGSKTYTCTVCGATKNETIAKTSHQYKSSVTKQATCTATGLKTYVCSVCGDSYTETIDKTAHKYKDATCTEPKTCSVCGKTDGKALGHDYTAKKETSEYLASAATGTTAAKYYYSCTRCGAKSTNTFSSGSAKTVKATSATISPEVFEVYPSDDASAFKLKVTVSPSNTTEKGTWTSSDNSIVSVDSNGKLTVNFKKVASSDVESVQITYKIGSVSADAYVLVYGSDPSSSDSTIVDAVLSQEDLTLDVGGSHKLTYAVYNAKGSNVTKTVKHTASWSTSDDKVAKVSSDGTVTAVGNGKAVVSLKIDGKKLASCSVTVNKKQTSSDAVKIQSISFSKSEITIKPGDVGQLEITVSPSNYTEELTWTSSDPSTVFVAQNGSFAGFVKGTATITVKSASGKSASCKIKVSDSGVSDVTGTLSATVSIAGITSGSPISGDIFTATVVFNSKSIDSTGFMYSVSCSDESVAEVTSNGGTSSNSFTIKLKKTGTVTLTPFVMDKNLKYTFVYEPFVLNAIVSDPTITTPIQKMTLALTASSAYEGETVKAYVDSVYPTNHNDRLFYYSSDPTVASVDINTGLVTAKKAGSCTIICRAQGKNYSTVEAKSPLTVKSKGTTQDVDSKSKIITLMRGVSDYVLNNPFNSKQVLWTVAESNSDKMTKNPIIANQEPATGNVIITVPADLEINNSATATGYPLTLVCYNYLSGENITYYIQISGKYTPTENTVIKKTVNVMVTSNGNLSALGLPYYGTGYTINYISGDAVISGITDPNPTLFNATSIPDGRTSCQNVYHVFNSSGTKVAEYTFTVSSNILTLSVGTGKSIRADGITGIYGGDIAAIESTDKNVAYGSLEYVQTATEKYFAWTVNTCGNNNDTATLTISYSNGARQYLKITIVGSGSSVLKKSASVMVTTSGSLESLGFPYYGAGYTIKSVSGSAAVSGITDPAPISYNAVTIPDGYTSVSNVYHVFDSSNVKIAEYTLTVTTNVVSYNLNAGEEVCISNLVGLYAGTVDHLDSGAPSIISATLNTGKWYIKAEGSVSDVASVVIFYTDGTKQILRITIK